MASPAPIPSTRPKRLTASPRSPPHGSRMQVAGEGRGGMKVRDGGASPNGSKIPDHQDQVRTPAARSALSSRWGEV
jgi:hypothetical protein